MSGVDVAFRHLLLNLCEEHVGSWVQCVAGAERFNCVGRVLKVDREAQGVEFETLGGGRWTTAVGVYLAIVVFGPEDQIKLHAQLAENVAAARRILQ